MMVVFGPTLCPQTKDGLLGPQWAIFQSINIKTNLSRRHVDILKLWIDGRIEVWSGPLPLDRKSIRANERQLKSQILNLTHAHGQNKHRTTNVGHRTTNLGHPTTNLGSFVGRTFKKSWMASIGNQIYLVTKKIHTPFWIQFHCITELETVNSNLN